MKIEVGQVFHRLVVVSLYRKDDRHRKFFLCRCSCGEEKVVQQALLVSGNTKSCGCYGRETRKRRGEISRLPDNGGAMNNLLLQYKRHARERGFGFSLTREEFASLVKSPCFYCGQPPSNTKRTKNDKEGLVYSGVDRKDSSMGYETGNVVSCCKTCNVAKSTMAIHEFKEWVLRVASMADQWS